MQGSVGVEDMIDYPQLRLGTAPDSWGVWFPDDPHQVTWSRYLDEVRES
jgi:inosose dehydratase